MFRPQTDDGAATQGTDIIDIILLGPFRAPCPHYSGLLPTCASVSDMYCLVTVVSPSRHAAFASNAIK